MKFDNRQIRRAAENVRRICELYAEETGEFDDDLCGLCGISSVLLFRRLTELGIHNIQIVNNSIHAFIIIDDYYLDVTATQFGRNRIIHKKYDFGIYNVPKHWLIVNRHYSDSDFINYQERYWKGEEQIFKEREHGSLLKRFPLTANLPRAILEHAND